MPELVTGDQAVYQRRTARRGNPLRTTSQRRAIPEKLPLSERERAIVAPGSVSTTAGEGGIPGTAGSPLPALDLGNSPWIGRRMVQTAKLGAQGLRVVPIGYRRTLPGLFPSSVVDTLIPRRRGWCSYSRMYEPTNRRPHRTARYQDLKTMLPRGYARPCRRLVISSTRTAIKIIAPVTICCQNALIPCRSSPLLIQPMISAPIKLPTTLP